MVAGAVAVPATLAIIGFAPAGIAAGKYLARSFLQSPLTKTCTGSIAAGIQSGIGASTTNQITLHELTKEFDRKRCGWKSLRNSAVCWYCATRHWIDGFS